jgi:histone-lysine N-methyltransferase SETMAR
VRENRNITVREIESTLGIGSSATTTILHDRLGLRKISSRWIPHLLTSEQKQQRIDWCHFMLSKFDKGRSTMVGNIVTGDETWVYTYDPETKQQSAVWVFQEEEQPTKVVRSRSASKRMVAVFFRRQGLVKMVPLLEQATVTAAWYTTVCLPAVFSELHTTRPKTGLRGILLHHDNASAHSAAKTVDFLHEAGVQLVPHPPYSPDLSPCDFFLFPKIKHLLKGTRFPDQYAAMAAFHDAILQLSADDWFSCFSDWFHRMSSCLNAGGEYFEKMK